MMNTINQNDKSPMRNFSLACMAMAKFDTDGVIKYGLELARAGNPTMASYCVDSLAANGRAREAAQLAEDVLLCLEKTGGNCRTVLPMVAKANCTAGNFERFFFLASIVADELGLLPNVPRWRGEPLQGKRLVIFLGSDGYGDNIMWARLIQLAANQGAHVLVQCHKPLLRLMERVPGVREAHPLDEVVHGDFSVHVFELPRVLGLSRHDLPGAAYIPCLPKKANGAKNIGISWGSGFDHPKMKRSCLLAELSALQTIPGAKLFSLEKSQHAKQIRYLPANMEVTDLAGSISDFADSADAIANMDAIVTTDNVVANLALTLGKPTFVLLPKFTDYRWISHDGHAWYPDARTYQQSEENDWGEPIRRVIGDLELFLATG